MFDGSHFRDQIGEVDQRLISIPSGDHDMLARRTTPEHVEHLLDLEPAESEAVGQLVQHDDGVGVALDSDSATIPSFTRQRAIVLEIGAGPGEPAAQGNYLNPKFACRARLAPVAALDLDELEHGDAQTLTPRPQEK